MRLLNELHHVLEQLLLLFDPDSEEALLTEVISEVDKPLRVTAAFLAAVLLVGHSSDSVATESREDSHHREVILLLCIFLDLVEECSLHRDHDVVAVEHLLDQVILLLVVDVDQLLCHHWLSKLLLVDFSEISELPEHNESDLERSFALGEVIDSLRQIDVLWDLNQVADTFLDKLSFFVQVLFVLSILNDDLADESGDLLRRKERRAQVLQPLSIVLEPFMLAFGALVEPEVLVSHLGSIAVDFHLSPRIVLVHFAQEQVF